MGLMAFSGQIGAARKTHMTYVITMKAYGWDNTINSRLKTLGPAKHIIDKS